MIRFLAKTVLWVLLLPVLIIAVALHGNSTAENMHDSFATFVAALVDD